MSGPRAPMAFKLLSYLDRVWTDQASEAPAVHAALAAPTETGQRFVRLDRPQLRRWLALDRPNLVRAARR